MARYRANENVFRQGDSANAVFYILKGKMKLAVVSEQGKEGVIVIPNPGDFISEGCLAGQAVAHGLCNRNSGVEHCLY